MKKLLFFAVIAASLAGCRNETKKNASYQVNASNSKAEWKGSAPDHFHIGSFQVTGSFSTDSLGVVKSGEFTIPIASIKDFDLPANVKPALLADLKDNFFKVVRHPNAKFLITSITAYRGQDSSAVKGANYLLTGDFNMIGQTHTISFPARISAKGDSLITQAKFNINRLQWGMKNYSDPSQKLYILPDVNIRLDVRAAKDKAPSALAYIGL